jgi:TolB protein
MNADGSGLRRLTDHPAYEGAPSWSPDGKWIAFEGERDGRSEIYRVDVESGRVVRLTDSFSRKLGPVVSIDGGSVVFMDRSAVRWQIVWMDLGEGESRVLTGGWGSCRPEWSPDGRLLAFVSTRDTNKADIRLLDMARETDWKLHTRPNAHNYDPAFSPDGLSLALSSTIERRPEEWDLFRVDINGRNLVQLTSGPENDRFPDWRPAPPKR